MKAKFTFLQSLMTLGSCDFEDDDGLPDAAFTQDELDAGVQHIMRSGCGNPSQGGYSTYSRDEDRTHSRPIPPVDTLRFSTFALAQAWAKANPGCTFSRATDGHGFEGKTKARIDTTDVNNSDLILKDVSSDQQRGQHDRGWRMKELKRLSPYTHDVLACWGNGYNVRFTHVFSDSMFTAEIRRLSEEQRRRVHDILIGERQWCLKYLWEVESEIRRNRRMKAGSYGEPSIRAVSERIQHALALMGYFNSKTDRNVRAK